MNLYWLSRKGGTAEGPFAESQIVAMWQNGLFAATDLLCMDGTKDWQPASRVILPPKQSEPALMPLTQREVSEWPAEPAETEIRYGRRIRVEENSCLAGVFAILGIGGLFFYIIPGLIFLAISAMLSRVSYSCSVCGNSVAKSSRVCPACQARLKRSRSQFADPWLWIVLIASVVILFLCLHR